MEGRVALLDPEFIEAYWMLPEEWRMPKYKGIEKYWLRKAFDGLGLLPDEILWRRKEPFTEGINSKSRTFY
jgi:asparagine synthase (glutamine-hydrolysing)